MPKVLIIMPQLGESIAEATVVRLTVNIGDQIESDQEVIEVETNKAVMSVTTPCQGLLASFIAEVNETSRSLRISMPIRAVDPDHLVLRPRKMRSGQRFSYLALDPEETRALNAAYHERIHLRPIQSHPARIRRPSSTRLSNSSPATATSKKAWAWMPLTGPRPAEIFFSATFSLPREKLPYPALLFDGQLENLAKLPVPVP
jgi:hypothetical protein